MSYALLRPLLFRIEAEKSHDVAMKTLQLAADNRLAKNALQRLYADRLPAKPVRLMGLPLKHCLGLAAGLDKQGVAGNALAALGFAWIEYGTVTPQPQTGNPKPRLFRLAKHQAIINRMGFNSIGLDAFLDNIKRTDNNVVKGLNIGKNAATPIEQAQDDYVLGMQAVYPVADYICVNISSPNTQNLRELQNDASLNALLQRLSETRKALQDQHGFDRPLVLKVAPDLASHEIDHIAKGLLKYGMDGLAATNTTLARDGVSGHRHAEQAGGLSGVPLAEQATDCIQQFYQRLQGEVAIIGSGGIDSLAQAQAKLQAGADALQLYTGFIYKGPRLIREIVKGL